MTTPIKRILIVSVMALALAPAAEQRSTAVDSSTLQWQSVELPGVPKGMRQKLLHDNQQNKMMSSIIRFPKGFRDPRHYHTTCSHSLYILKGKLQSTGGMLTPGMFVYSAVNEEHGPFIALEETDMVLWTDGPLDYHVAEKK